MICVVFRVSNFLMNLGFCLVGLLQVGLALTTSLAAFLNAGLLMAGLYRDGVFRFQAGWLVFLLRILLANAAMVVFLMSFSGDWQEW